MFKVDYSKCTCPLPCGGTRASCPSVSNHARVIGKLNFELHAVRCAEEELNAAKKKLRETLKENGVWCAQCNNQHYPFCDVGE